MTASATRPAHLSELELGAWRGLLRAHASLVKTLDSELDAQHRLPLSSYEVLLHLEEGRLRMCELAEQVLLSRSGLTRLIDRLVRDGYVERVVCDHDARGAYAALTAAGREKLAAARETHLAGVREHFLAHFTAAELGELGSYWMRLGPAASEG
ncbi:MAG: MarR family transcriptional regulator [Solirubrobacteraceae bacterium]